MNNIKLNPQTNCMSINETAEERKFKKFRSAYILFSLDYRRELKKKFPNYGNPELTKMIAAEWKKLDITQKEVYYLKEREEKENFERKKKENQMEYKYNKNEKSKKPLRFRTPYMFYIMDHKLFLNNKDKYKNIELIKKLSEKWKSMPDEEKLPYIEKSNSDKKRYQQDWEDYIKSYFKVKKKNIRKKEKTERMVLDLLKLCNNNKNFHSHLQSVWHKLNSSGQFNEVYNVNGKYKNKILLKRLIFKIEKVPKSLKDEIKYEKSKEEDENVFSKYIKEEFDDDSSENLFEIDDMMDIVVQNSNTYTSKYLEETKQSNHDLSRNENDYFAFEGKRNLFKKKK